MARTALKFAVFIFLIVLVGLPARAAAPVRILLQEDRLEEALPLCRQFEVLSTNDFDNFVACAWVYFRTDRIESAEKLMELHKAKITSPEYQLLLAYGRIKKKQFDEARRIINSVAVDRRGTPQAITAQELNAEIYELNGQLDTAAFIYKQVVGDDAGRIRAHWGLGRYYLVRGDQRRAIMHLETAAKAWPKHKGSRFNLAVLYLNAEMLPDAAKWLAECYRLDKGDPEILEQLGLLFEKKGMIPEAIKHWQRAVELKKDATVAKEKLNRYVIQVIDTLIDAKQYEKALSQLETATKGVSDVHQVQLRKGIVLRNLHKFDKAVGELLAFVNVYPTDPVALRELGICYTNLKLVDQAAAYFARAAAAEPQNGINFAWLAFMFEQRGDLFRARENWQRAAELLKDPAELEKATRKLATIQKKIGNKKEKEKDDED